MLVIVITFYSLFSGVGNREGRAGAHSPWRDRSSLPQAAGRNHAHYAINSTYTKLIKLEGIGSINWKQDKLYICDLKIT